MATPRNNTYSVASGGGVFAGRLGDARVAIWGQSNAVGRASRAEISQAPLSSDPELATYDAGTFSRVRIWNGSAYVNLQPSVFNGQTVFAGQFGPEFGLAVRWMRETSAGTLFIDKNCDGGISITEFAPPSAAFFASGATESAQGDAWIASNGFSVGRKAMLWVQGEQDAAQSESWYRDRLDAMLAAVRSEGILGASSLVLLAQMPTASAANGAGVAAAKAAHVAANPGNSQTVAMRNYLGDSVHLDARGQVQLGYDAFRLIFGGAQIEV